MSYKVTLFILRESTQGQRGSAKPSKNKPAKRQQVKSVCKYKLTLHTHQGVSYAFAHLIIKQLGHRLEHRARAAVLGPGLRILPPALLCRMHTRCSMSHSS